MMISTRSAFQQLISELHISDNAAEFHGFLSGLIAGGVQDESWKTLTYQFTNDGHAFSQAVLTKLSEFYQQLSENYAHADTQFELWLPEGDDSFALADSLAEWTSHFLLGLGLAQPKLQQESGEVAEAIGDLDDISKLGYSDEDSNEELLEAAEEVLTYLRVVSLFLHSHFTQHSTPTPRTGAKLH